jgi:hypothetical protein
MSDLSYQIKWPLYAGAIMSFGPVLYMTVQRPVYGLAWLVFAIITAKKVYNDE